MTDKPETDTSVLKRLAPGLAWIPRNILQRITLPAVWCVLLSLIGIITTGFSRVIHDETNIEHLDTSVKSLESQQEMLQKINTQLQVLDTKVDIIGSEVDRQRQWRERIEDVAEIPPHARRK